MIKVVDPLPGMAGIPFKDETHMFHFNPGTKACGRGSSSQLGKKQETRGAQESVGHEPLAKSCLKKSCTSSPMRTRSLRRQYLQTTPFRLFVKQTFVIWRNREYRYCQKPPRNCKQKTVLIFVDRFVNAEKK